MDSKEYDYFFKLLLAGDSRVGKSSTLLQYVDRTFSDAFLTTIGVEFQIRTIRINNKIVKLEIWDIAGQERFRTESSQYYKGANGMIVIYDVTDKSTFENIQHWISENEKYAGGNVVKLLVGNKIDLEDDREVSYDEGKQQADNLGIPFIETSAKNNENIEDSFLKLASELLNSQENSKIKETPQGQNQKQTEQMKPESGIKVNQSDAQWSERCQKLEEENKKLQDKIKQMEQNQIKESAKKQGDRSADEQIACLNQVLIISNLFTQQKENEILKKKLIQVSQELNNYMEKLQCFQEDNEQLKKYLKIYLKSLLL